MAKRMPIADFVKALYAAYQRHDGYIMAATGQDPKNWAKTSWWFTQYDNNPKQKAKALYWREHAARVWDCNGLAEGIYKDYSGIDINTQAKYNYSTWCDPKGSGMIPAKYRVPGAAVFWGNNAASIHHVAYLYKPVDANKTSGDWYIIEARGVMYGVVMTRLYERNPNYWGWITKYFDYTVESASLPTNTALLGYRILKNGSEGDDVKELQSDLIRLGFDCGKWGADGDFGDATEMAVKAFQCYAKIEVDGIVGPKTVSALEAALAALEKPKENPRQVEIVGGTCYVRSAPKVADGNIMGAVIAGTKLPYQGERSDDGWFLIEFKGKNGWVSGKYARLVE